MNRRCRTALLVGFTMALVSLAASAPAAVAADRLPDLQMAGIEDIKLDKTTLTGRKLLRFSTLIVNMGVGPFELRGSRPNTSTPEMSVIQRIYNDTGGHRDIPTTATMYYAGDGHNHWHTKNLESAELDQLDSFAQVAVYAKQGFCFADGSKFRTSLPGAPSNAVYLGCGNDPSQLTTTMGLSIGWGDHYNWTLAFQWIDITGVPSGRYRLFLTPDAAHWFQESDETNNTTWADILLGPKGVTVLGYGPAATPDPGLAAPGSLGPPVPVETTGTGRRQHKPKKHPR